MDTPTGQILEYTANVLNHRLAVEQLMNSKTQYDGMMPWLQRPPDARDFTPTGVGLIGAVGTTTTLLTYLVPNGYDGRINGIFFQYLASSFDIGDIYYRMFIDGRPVDNLEAIQTNIGSSQFPWEIFIRVFSGNVVTMVVNHVANGTLDTKEVQVGMKGWLYARSEA